jgi:hypothetical protein
MTTLKNYQIDIKNVMSSYSGKDGCMCGCKGKYSYSTLNRDIASKDRGYVVSDSDISDIAVKRMVNKFNKLGSVSVDVFADGRISDYIYINVDGRMNCIYLVKGTMKGVTL